MTIGMLWWFADSVEEAQQWRSEYLGKGALLVEIKPSKDNVTVLITLYRERARAILGYEPEIEEWLDISELEAESKALGFPSVDALLVDRQSRILSAPFQP